MTTTYLDTNFDLTSPSLIETLDELPFWSAPFGIKLLQHVCLKKNMTVLDIGFGTGFPLTELAMRLGNTSRVFGIDPWDTAIKRTEKKIRNYHISTIKILRGGAEEIPLEDNTVDLITSNNGINNVADTQKVYQECSRIMKKGGQFIQTINTDKSFSEFYSILEKVLIDMDMPEAVEHMTTHIEAKRKPLREILEISHKNNFDVENVIHDQFEYRFVDGTTMFNHYFIQLAFLDSWKKLVPSKKQKEVFEEVERMANLVAEKKGSFIATVPFMVIDCIKR
jgi:arsenite methyltransferase